MILVKNDGYWVGLAPLGPNPMPVGPDVARAGSWAGSTWIKSVQLDSSWFDWISVRFRLNPDRFNFDQTGLGKVECAWSPSLCRSNEFKGLIISFDHSFIH